jgi:hypothetical protein
MRLSVFRIALSLLLLVSFRPGLGAAPARRFMPSLAQLTARSGYIFAGTVLHVERATAAGTNQIETVQVQFRVDQAVRGVKRNQVFTLREWMGLWNTGERYRPGERVFLFLYPASKLGLSSPVGGALGRFAVDAKGQIVLTKSRLAVLRPELPKRTAGRDGVPRLDTREFARAVSRAGGLR